MHDDLKQLLSDPSKDRWTDGTSVRLDLSAEELGLVTDGLIAMLAEAERRKAANTESTSDLRAEMCIALISRLNPANAPVPQTEPRRI